MTVQRQLASTETRRRLMTFDTFDLRFAERCESPQTLIDAHKAAKRFAAKPSKFLCIYSAGRVGKTHLAMSIVNEHPDNALFWDVSAMFEHLRSLMILDTGRFLDAWKDLLRARLLVLDDLGGQHFTEWTLERMRVLIGHRYEREMPTVVTSRYVLSVQVDPCEPYTHWGAIRSRLGHREVVEEHIVR